MTDTVTPVEEPKGVQIAKDVLAQLAARDRYRLHRQHYIIFTDHKLHLRVRFGEGASVPKDLQQLLPEINADNCTVCLIGACLLSKARLFDAVPTASISVLLLDGSRFDVFAPLFDGIFSDEELTLMECVFEGCLIQSSCTADHDLIRAAVHLGRQIVDREEAVVAVMDNIIANAGRFVLAPMSRADFDAVHRRRDIYTEPAYVGFEDEDEDEDCDCEEYAEAGDA